MTLLGAEPGVEVVVAEMGARREGDVRLLCDVARPDAVVVTNVGTAHLGIFGSWDAIVRAGSAAGRVARPGRHRDRERRRSRRARVRRTRPTRR